MQNTQIVRSSEENAQDLAQLLNRLSGDLEAAIPMVKQLFFDFRRLRKGELIMGCATQDQWAQKYAKRTARALRYMFEGGNPVSARRPKALVRAPEVLEQNRTETVSVLPGRILEPGPVAPLADPIRVAEVPELEPLLDTSIPAIPVITSAETHLQKLQADLLAERTKVTDLKRLVILSMGGENAYRNNIYYLDSEGRQLFDRYIGS